MTPPSGSERAALEDVDAERGVVTIWEGKGKKDRVVPIGKRALEWIEAYLARSRPQLAKRLDEPALFLTAYGNDFTAVGMSRAVKRAIEASGVQKPGSCHLFRHTIATLMLEGGADVRFIQELLGHKHLNTTQIYTSVSIRKLQEVHAKTHPGCAERSVPPEVG